MDLKHDADYERKFKLLSEKPSSNRRL